jgi:hypothetical protein
VQASAYRPDLPASPAPAVARIEQKSPTRACSCAQLDTLGVALLTAVPTAVAYLGNRAAGGADPYGFPPLAREADDRLAGRHALPKKVNASPAGPVGATARQLTVGCPFEDRGHVHGNAPGVELRGLRRVWGQPGESTIHPPEQRESGSGPVRSPHARTVEVERRESSRVARSHHRFARADVVVAVAPSLTRRVRTR